MTHASLTCTETLTACDRSISAPLLHLSAFVKSKWPLGIRTGQGAKENVAVTAFEGLVEGLEGMLKEKEKGGIVPDGVDPMSFLTTPLASLLLQGLDDRPSGRQRVYLASVHKGFKIN